MLADAQDRVTARVWEPPVRGDLDCDRDVDIDDFGMLAACLEGPGSAAPLGCHNADLDEDGDVDLADFAELQHLMATP